MPRKSFINFLPDHVLNLLNQKLKDEGFSNYYHIADWFNELLEQEGLELRIQKSAINNYGQDFEKKLNQIKTATMQAKSIVEASEAGDQQSELAGALTLMIQQKYFELLRDIETESLRDGFDLAKATRAISDLTRSGISNKKYASEIKLKIDAARNEIKEIKEIKGLSEDTLRRVDEILGAISV